MQNQIMSLQHVLEMASLFISACASSFYHVWGHFVEHL
jgi:hypothetical protein